MSFGNKALWPSRLPSREFRSLLELGSGIRGGGNAWRGTGSCICHGCWHSSTIAGVARRPLPTRMIETRQKGFGVTVVQSTSLRFSSSDSNSRNTRKSEAAPETAPSSTTTAPSSATSSSSASPSNPSPIPSPTPTSTSKPQPPPPPPPPDHDDLPSQEEQRRSPMTKRFSSLMDNMQANIFLAGKRLNDLTGYTGIEALKREVETLEASLRNAKSELAGAKAAYSGAITQRSDSQREVNELLQRKNSWTGADLERFTSLYRNDHANELAESGARERLAAAERAADEASAQHLAKSLARYHEEQIWSDKIRRQSTWGTWGLMGVNVLLFLVFQVMVEPWRRRRLVHGFEEKVKEALEDSNRSHLEATGEALTALQAGQLANAAVGAEGLGAEEGAVERAEEAVDRVVREEVQVEDGVVVLEAALEPEPAMWFTAWMPELGVCKKKVEELFSEREVTVRQVDLTQKALEGVFVGVMVTSVIATLVRGR